MAFPRGVADEVVGDIAKGKEEVWPAVGDSSARELVVSDDQQVHPPETVGLLFLLVMDLPTLVFSEVRSAAPLGSGRGRALGMGGGPRAWVQFCR